MNNKFKEFAETYLDEVCSEGDFYSEYDRINWERDIVDFFIEDDSSSEYKIEDIEANRDDLENIALELIEDYKSIVDEEAEDMRELEREYREVQGWKF